MDVDDAAPEQLARPALRTQQCTRNLQCPTTYFRLRMCAPRRDCCRTHATQACADG
jgi:hypothetical protein